MDLSLFDPDAIDLGAELVLGPAFFGSEVEEVAFLLFQLRQTRGVLLPQGVGQLGVGVDRFVQAGPDLIEPVRRQGERVGVVGGDGFLQHLDGDARQVAEPLLAASAVEVVVIAAVPALGVGDDQAVFAASAPDQSAQVVVVGAVPDVQFGVLGQDVLDVVEQFLGDERFVPAVVLNALVIDVADVVAVAEQECDLGGGDRAALVAAGHGHAEAGLGELGAQRFVGLLAGGE